MSSTLSRQQWQQIEARANGVCEYCKSPVQYAVQSFECEHILPAALGGETVLDNLAFACGGCNRCKSTKTTGIDPDNGQAVPLFHPRHQQWHDHFIWNEDFTLIIGMSATGRATINVLRLNRLGVVNLRRILITAGEHPPTES
jgi:hypothetical protein